jgi:hypothetical protein
MKAKLSALILGLTFAGISQAVPIGFLAPQMTIR